jgi:putative copper export protein
MSELALVWLLGLSRGLHVAAYFAAFGALCAEGFFVRAPVKGMRRLAGGAFLLAVLFGAVWFVAVTIGLTGAGDWADVWVASPIVALQTRFGYLLLGRLLVLLVALLLGLLGFKRLGAGLAFGGCVAQAWLGHGAAMLGSNDGDGLFGCALAHVGGAALWMGALPAMLLVVACADEADVGPAMRRFSKLAKGSVAAIIGTAVVQFWLLIGGLQAFLGSAYGLFSLAKIVLLVVLLALAYAPRLVPRGGSRALSVKILAAETAVGLLVLVLAGFLLEFEAPTMAAMGM